MVSLIVVVTLIMLLTMTMDGPVIFVLLWCVMTAVRALAMICRLMLQV